MTSLINQKIIHLSTAYILINIKQITSRVSAVATELHVINQFKNGQSRKVT